MTTIKKQEEDLEALFDGIVASRQTDHKKVTAVRSHKRPNKNKLKNGKNNKLRNEVISHIGQLTRKLHNTLHRLGYDKNLEKTLSAIPDTKDRLSYIANVTEKAAQRVLTAVEIAKPIQEELATNAEHLSKRWQNLFDKKLNIEEFKELVSNTRSYLVQLPQHTKATSAQLLEIMMAQDFQDLTGQVIKKVTELAKEIETELLEVLVAHSQISTHPSTDLLDGPVIKAAGRSDIVVNQDQVDELLESLGF